MTPIEKFRTEERAAARWFAALYWPVCIPLLWLTDGGFAVLMGVTLSPIIWLVSLYKSFERVGPHGTAEDTRYSAKT